MYSASNTCSNSYTSLCHKADLLADHTGVGLASDKNFFVNLQKTCLDSTANLNALSQGGSVSEVRAKAKLKDLRFEESVHLGAKQRWLLKTHSLRDNLTPFQTKDHMKRFSNATGAVTDSALCAFSSFQDFNSTLVHAVAQKGYEHNKDYRLRHKKLTAEFREKKTQVDAAALAAHKTARTYEGVVIQLAKETADSKGKSGSLISTLNQQSMERLKLRAERLATQYEAELESAQTLQRRYHEKDLPEFMARLQTLDRSRLDYMHVYLNQYHKCFEAMVQDMTQALFALQTTLAEMDTDTQLQEMVEMWSAVYGTCPEWEPFQSELPVSPSDLESARFEAVIPSLLSLPAHKKDKTEPYSATAFAQTPARTPMSPSDTSSHVPLSEEGKMCTALYSLEEDSVKGVLPIVAGQLLVRVPHPDDDEDWFRVQDPETLREGFVPRLYVEFQNEPNSGVDPSSQPEVTSPRALTPLSLPAASRPSGTSACFTSAPSSSSSSSSPSSSSSSSSSSASSASSAPRPGVSACDDDASAFEAFEEHQEEEHSESFPAPGTVTSPPLAPLSPPLSPTGFPSSWATWSATAPSSSTANTASNPRKPSQSKGGFLKTFVPSAFLSKTTAPPPSTQEEDTSAEPDHAPSVKVHVPPKEF